MLGFSKKEDGIEEDDKIFVSISNVLFNYRIVFTAYERKSL